MKTAPKITNVISELTSVPQSTVETVLRNLGEAGLVQRGTRGRKPPEMSSKDLARLLFGVMSVADGIEGSAARVVQAVNRVSRLRCQGTPKISNGDIIDTPSYDRGETFIKELTLLIEQCADPAGAPEVVRLIRAVGLTYAGGIVLGWTEVTEEAEPLPDRTAHVYTRDFGGSLRVIFGAYDKHTKLGMTREVNLNIDTVVKLATFAFPGSTASGPADDISR